MLMESWLWGDRNIDDVDKTMDEINEQTENMKQIQEALATPIGAAADIDEVLSVFCIVVFCIQVLATHGCLGTYLIASQGHFGIQF
jgi:hypothetical protein